MIDTARLAAPVIALLLVSGRVSATDRWPQFRGEHAAGVSQEARLPETWSTKENVAWVSEIPGRGWSSPVVWGERVFVTSAVSPGPFKEPSPGI